MTNAIEDYYNAIPDGYALFALFVVMFCGYTVAFGLADLVRFESNYYFWKAIRGVLGFLCGLTVWLWPIPVAWFVIRRIILGNCSEWDEVMRYHKRWGEGMTHGLVSGLRQQ